MIGRETLRLRASLAFLAGLAIASFATAAESAETEKRAGLESAKRDYKALESAKSHATEQSAAPRAELPVLDATSPSAQPLLPTRSKRRAGETADEIERREKSSNWLIEAMRAENEPPVTAGEKALEKRLDPHRAAVEQTEKGDLVETALALQKQDAAARKAEDERRSEIERRQEMKAINPLDTFMASWMTTKDFELLGRSAGETREPRPFDTTALAPARVAETSALAVPLLEDVREPTASPLGLDRANPYLANLPDLGSLTSSAPASAPLSTPFMPEFSAPASSLTGTPDAVAPEPQRTPLSESFRSNDDAKYFKQLKRF